MTPKTPCPVCGQALPKPDHSLSGVKCEMCEASFSRYVYAALRRLSRLSENAKIEREFWRLQCPTMTYWNSLKRAWHAMTMVNRRPKTRYSQSKIAAMRALLAAVKNRINERTGA